MGQSISLNAQSRKENFFVVCFNRPQGAGCGFHRRDHLQYVSRIRLESLERDKLTNINMVGLSKENKALQIKQKMAVSEAAFYFFEAGTTKAVVLRH